jgi:2-keto-3-deoxy-L-rhamnonate aldolase RhmA/pimeloyl-ACP methyl ester carboxylesterase
MNGPGPETFGSRFRRGDRLIGALVRMPNEGLVELAGLVGLDFVVIDTEHGPGDQLALAHHLIAAAANGLATIVRIGRPEEALRVLDLGVDGILAPHVSSVDQARALIDAVHYPPLGRRGFGHYSRAGRYGLTAPAEHHARARETVVVAMIEDPLGLAAAAEIAGLDGIDGLMLGPADYACELGVVGQLDDPRVVVAAGAVRDTARAGGVAAVSIVGERAAAVDAFAAGDTAVMYNVQLLLGKLLTGLVAARPAASSEAPPAGISARAGTRSAREELVLVPGMLGDATVWDAVPSELLDVAAPRFARIDLDDSITEMAASVLATAPDRFALAGHSLGAIVALEIMRQAPERVTRLALINATGRGPSAEQQQAWSATIDRLESGHFTEIAAELARRTLAPQRRDDAELVATNERMAFAVAADGMRRQLRAQQGRTSYLGDLALFAVPVLIVSGALDEVCPPERQAELLAHCPQAHLVTLPDAGHTAPLEQPVALAAHLRTWLTARV